MRCLPILVSGNHGRLMARAMMVSMMLTILVASCASVGVTKTGSSQPPKPEGCNLDVYDDPASIDRPYRQVCLIDSKTGSSLMADKSVAGAINEARPAACQCGADAIIFTSGDTEGASMTGWGHGKAIIRAIVYTSDDDDDKKPKKAKKNRHRSQHDDDK